MHAGVEALLTDGGSQRHRHFRKAERVAQHGVGADRRPSRECAEQDVSLDTEPVAPQDTNAEWYRQRSQGNGDLSVAAHLCQRAHERSGCDEHGVGGTGEQLGDDARHAALRAAKHLRDGAIRHPHA